MADPDALYDNDRSPKQEKSKPWKHAKTGKAVSTQRGDEKEIDGENYEAIGHLDEEPENYRSMKDDKGDAGSGTLKGNDFDRTTNDGVLWRKKPTKPTS